WVRFDKSGHKWTISSLQMAQYAHLRGKSFPGVRSSKSFVDAPIVADSDGGAQRVLHLLHGEKCRAPEAKQAVKKACCGWKRRGKLIHGRRREESRLADGTSFANGAPRAKNLGQPALKINLTSGSARTAPPSTNTHHHMAKYKLEYIWLDG